MRLFKITNGFDQMTDAYLIVRANAIKSGVATHGDYFPNPSPSLADLGGTITAFTDAVEKAEGGDRQAVAARNAVRETLIDQLHLLGNFVLYKAGGDPVIATASGFNISRQPSPKPALTVPQGLVLKNGLNKGELQLRFKRVVGATAYKYEIAPSPITEETQWQSALNTVSKNLFTGLESGKEYNCRVAAIGSKEQVVYSGVVTRIAL